MTTKDYDWGYTKLLQEGVGYAIYLVAVKPHQTVTQVPEERCMCNWIAVGDIFNYSVTVAKHHEESPASFEVLEYEDILLESHGDYLKFCVTVHRPKPSEKT